MGEHGFEFVEDGFAESGGHTAHDAGDGPADGVEGVLGTDDALGGVGVNVSEIVKD